MIFVRENPSKHNVFMTVYLMLKAKCHKITNSCRAFATFLEHKTGSTYTLPLSSPLALHLQSPLLGATLKF